MQISDKAIETIRESNKAQAALMAAFNIGQKSVQNWLDRKDIRLTTPDAIKAITESTGIPESEILTEEPVTV